MQNQNTKITVKVPSSSNSQMFVSRTHLLEMSLYSTIAEGYLTMKIHQGRQAEFYEELAITNSYIEIQDFAYVLEFLALKDMSQAMKLKELFRCLQNQSLRESVARCFQYPIYHSLSQQKFKDPTEYQILTALATFLNVKLKILRKTLEVGQNYNQTEILPQQSFSCPREASGCVELIRKYDKFVFTSQEEEVKNEKGHQYLQLKVNQPIYKQFLAWGNKSEDASEWCNQVDDTTVATPRQQIDLRVSEGWDQTTIGKNRLAIQQNASRSKLSLSLIDVGFEMVDEVQEESRDLIQRYTKIYLKKDKKAALIAKIEKKYITLDTCKDTVSLEGILKNIAQRFKLNLAKNLFMIHQEEVDSPCCSQCGLVLNPTDLTRLFQHLNEKQIFRLYSIYYSHRKQSVSEPNPLYLEKVVNYLMNTRPILSLTEWKSKHQKLDKKIERVYNLLCRVKMAIPEKKVQKKDITALRKQLDKLSILARSTGIHNDRIDTSILRETCVEILRVLNKVTPLKQS